MNLFALHDEVGDMLRKASAYERLQITAAEVWPCLEEIYAAQPLSVRQAPFWAELRNLFESTRSAEVEP